MTSFLNPYHFRPVEKGKGFVDREAVAKALGAVKPRTKTDGENNDLDKTPDEDAATASTKLQRLRHDRFEPGAYSGRIVCRLTTVTPCVFGGEQLSPERPRTESARVLPYRLADAERGLVGGGEAELAVPATSLRGCLGSLIEAASGSSLRVLNDTQLSARSRKENSRTAIGIVVELGKEEGGRNRPMGLVPLTFPFVDVVHDGSSSAAKRLRFRDGGDFPGDAPAWRALVKRLRNASAEPLPFTIPSYFGAYPTTTNNNNRRRPHAMRWGNDHRPALDRMRSHSSECLGELWCMPVPRMSYSACSASGDKSAPDIDVTPARERLNLKGKAVVPFNLAGTTPRRYDPTKGKREGETLGIIRHLSPPDRGLGQQNVPGDKKHELFIPIEHLLDDQNSLADLAALPQMVDATDAVADFEKSVANLQETLDKPIMRLKGMPPKGRVALRTGDLVHFRLNLENGADPVVESLAISSIWREQCGSVGEWFARVSEELLPYSSQRKQLSPAELVLGFVSRDGLTATSVDSLSAYASRLRFSPARRVGTDDSGGLMAGGAVGFRKGDSTPHSCDGGLFRLQILSSPKPPSPAMYFGKKSGPKPPSNGPVKAADLRTQEESVSPLGAKVYLHGCGANEKKNGRYPWETGAHKDSANQKLLVQPVKAGETFYFHIDFENLDQRELSLLYYALDPDAKEPESEFRHKLGLGKPLGLGSVHIEPQGVFLVDRPGRYREQQDLLIAVAGEEGEHAEAKGIDRQRPQRYDTAVLVPTADKDNWPERYTAERESAVDSAKELSELFTPRAEIVTDATHRAIVALGSWSAAKKLHENMTSLGYPSTTDDHGNLYEDLRYQWFTETSDQCLRPLGGSGESSNHDELSKAVLRAPRRRRR